MPRARSLLLSSFEPITTDKSAYRQQFTKPSLADEKRRASRILLSVSAENHVLENCGSGGHRLAHGKWTPSAPVRLPKPRRASTSPAYVWTTFLPEHAASKIPATTPDRAQLSGKLPACFAHLRRRRAANKCPRGGVLIEVTADVHGVDRYSSRPRHLSCAQ